MNSLHDARAWEIVRRLAEYLPQNTPAAFTALRSEAQELLAQASELEEAKRMIAHLQSIRRGLLEAGQNIESALNRAYLMGAVDVNTQSHTNLAVCRESLKLALETAQAGKIPPQVQTVKILGETPIQREAL